MPSPSTFDLTVEDYLSGVRIDSFLVKHFRNYTPFRIQRMVRAGLVRINGATVALQQRVFAGQRVTVRLVEPPDKLFDPDGWGPLPLEILYEDPWLIIVNKPPGQVTHPVGEFQSGTLCNVLQHHLDTQAVRSELRGLLRPGIVHRLDRETSGVLVVSKEHLSHRRLSIQFQRGKVEKTYLALVEGEPVPAQGVIDAPIGLLGRVSSILMSAGPDARHPKPARTRYELSRRFDRKVGDLKPGFSENQVSLLHGNPVIRRTGFPSHFSLLSVTPLTGRIHQIRVHLAAIGHPVVGDEFYGPFGEIRSAPRCEAPGSTGTTTAEPLTRHALHARRIRFAHPITGEQMDFTAPLPEDLQQLLAKLSSPLPAEQPA